MPTQFDASLTKLKDQLLGMGALAERMVLLLNQVLSDNEVARLPAIYEAEERLDSLQVELDEETVRMIGVYTPVAGDLRRLLMMTRINAELERIGDQVVDVAHTVESFLQKQTDEPKVDFSVAAEIAQRMVRRALDAFANRSDTEAEGVIAGDDEMDRITDSTVQTIFTQLSDGSREVRHVLGLILTAQALERIADHAVNIAEDVIYMVKGKDVRHLHLESPAAPSTQSNETAEKSGEQPLRA